MKTLTFIHDNKSYRAGLSACTRKTQYGYTELKAYDLQGQECLNGSVSEDGTTLFGKQAFESVYIGAGGAWVDKKQVQELDENGCILPVFEPTQTIELNKSTSIGRFLEFRISDVYLLDSLELLPVTQDKIFMFNYNATKNTRQKTGFLLNSGDSVFMLLGSELGFSFISPEECSDDNELLDDDDIDFSMF